MAIYSVLLLAEVGLSGTQEIAPDEVNTRVLRCIDVYWGGGTTGGPSVHVLGSAGQTIFECHVTTEVPGDAIDSHHWQWTGRQVIPPGGPIAVTGSGPPVDVTISGYSLAP